MGRKYTLVVSMNHGRYALDRPDGFDITAGIRLVARLGNSWMSGRVEHGPVYSGECGIERGYYFIADSGACCGLCVGMQVQVC
jgi:hypothetical protein